MWIIDFKLSIDPFQRNNPNLLFQVQDQGPRVRPFGSHRPHWPEPHDRRHCRHYRNVRCRFRRNRPIERTKHYRYPPRGETSWKLLPTLHSEKYKNAVNNGICCIFAVSEVFHQFSHFWLCQGPEPLARYSLLFQRCRRQNFGQKLF